jgi:hypothetical protein
VDETYVKVAGTWRYLFRAIDQFGQVVDVFLSPGRDASAARRFFAQAIDRTRISPIEVTTDRYRVYPRVLDQLLPAAFHDTELHANNLLETDHGRLKARLRPMRGLNRDRTARSSSPATPSSRTSAGLLRSRYRRTEGLSTCRRLRRTGSAYLIPTKERRARRVRASHNATAPFMAQRAGSTTVQFDDASHVGGLTHDRARFVKLIEQAIDATVT